MIGRAPDAAVFEALARAAFMRIPEPFAQHLRDVVVRVEEFAGRETLNALGIADEWGLTGLYHGRPIDQQSIWDATDMPPMITLFRQPLLAEWAETGVGLEELVSHVVIHEVGHHFGLSDADMHAIERLGE